MHGELAVRTASPWASAGSSPRAWGTRGETTTLEVEYRFIPTCMGNSVPPHTLTPRRPVHPHVHGELKQAQETGKPVVGSSPRAWGTPVRRDPSHLSIRFIPTCMGNSRSTTGPATRRSVHPHVHGELYVQTPDAGFRVGSSPRAWGTLEIAGEALEPVRFIPTCMGNSQGCPGQGGHLAVHPHVHGELFKLFLR